MIGTGRANVFVAGQMVFAYIATLGTVGSSGEAMNVVLHGSGHTVPESEET